MIVVEGPDGAGKTTLIRELSARYGLEVNERVVSKETNAMFDLKQWVEQNLNEGFQWKLFDRHRLISEFIYGPVLRKNQRFTDRAWVWNALRRFQLLSPTIIYCLPPLEIVRANVMYDDDNTAVAHSIEQIYAGYVHRASLDDLAKHNVIVWDYTTDGQETDPLRIFDSTMAMARARVN